MTPLTPKFRFTCPACHDINTYHPPERAQAGDGFQAQCRSCKGYSLLVLRTDGSVSSIHFIGKSVIGDWVYPAIVVLVLLAAMVVYYGTS